MVVTVRVVWPEFGDERLQELIREHPDDVWRVDVFPNFVTYRRQIEALKTVCIKSYLEPKPAPVVQHILTSLISDRNVSAVERERFDVDEAESGREVSGGDYEEGPLQAASNVEPRLVSDNVKAVGSNSVLPSDVVTDEAPPDEVELPPRLQSVREDAGTSGAQGIKPSSYNILPQTKEQDRTQRHQHRTSRRITSCGDLNESQRLAVENAINEPLTIVQGPPGTGKTKTAAAVVKEWLSLDQNQASKVITMSC